MSWKKYRFGDFLKRSKIPIDIHDDIEYKRVTIKTKHQGVSVRDTEKGKKIGTKKQFILKGGQFVLSKIDARYGAFGIAPDEVDGSIITGNFWAYDVDFSIINIEWFNQFTNSQDFYNVCERASSGITHRKYLNENFFLNYEIDLPSVEEQLIIVESFKCNQKTLFNQSYELNHQLSLVKQLRQAFLREAMQGKLIPQDPNDEPASVLLEKIKAEKEQLIKGKKNKKDKTPPPLSEDEIPFEIPENWVWCRLGDIFSVEKGLVGIQKAKEGEFPLVVTGEQRLTHNEYHFEGKAVIVPTVSSTGHGHASLKRIHYQEGKFAVGNILACIMPLRPEHWNMKFIYHYLDTYKEFFFVEKMKGAANVSLKISSIKETPIPCIPIEIQNKYEELIEFCNALEKRIKQSHQQNEALLRQVLREALEVK